MNVVQSKSSLGLEKTEENDAADTSEEGRNQADQALENTSSTSASSSTITPKKINKTPKSLRRIKPSNNKRNRASHINDHLESDPKHTKFRVITD